MTDEQLSLLAQSFCAAPLPESVCADVCATKQGHGRLGTNLLTVAEAKMVLGHALAATTARPTERGSVERLMAAFWHEPLLEDTDENRVAVAAAIRFVLTPPVTVAATDQAGAVAIGLVRDFLEILTIDCGVSPCAGSMASAEDTCGRAVHFLAALVTQPAIGPTMGGEDGR